MTSIRIRHQEDADAKPLGDVAFDQLDTVIPTINYWGIADMGGADLAGQFVYGDRGAYFEVVIYDEDPE